MHFELIAEDMQKHAHALVEFHSNFTDFFLTSTRSVVSHALEYLKGILLLEPRRNMSRMSAKVADKNEQSLSHFISNSPWKDEPLIETIGKDAVGLLSGDEITGGLILDESGFPKQGTESVGVARQYCGALGKVDNCQVGIFLAYSTPTEATLIERRLYLPKEWVNDPQRCEKAGIPLEARQFRTKAQLGLERILKAKKRGIPFAFVGMDAHYGEQPWLLTELEQSMFDICSRCPLYHQGLSRIPEDRDAEKEREPGTSSEQTQSIARKTCGGKELAFL